MQNDLSSMMDLSICHINVCSIKAICNGERLKLDLIRSEMLFNIITLSKTWLANNDNLNYFEIQGFQPPGKLEHIPVRGMRIASYAPAGSDISSLTCLFQNRMAIS